MKTNPLSPILRHSGAALAVVSLCGSTCLAQSPSPQPAAAPPAALISGAAPVLTASRYQQIADLAYAKFKGDREGSTSVANPRLTSVPGNLSGIAIVTVDGRVFTAGDADYSFALEGASKPFTMSLLLQQSGYEVLVAKIGSRDLGMTFSSVSQPQLMAGQVPRGFDLPSIAGVSLVEASSAADRWQKILGFYGKCAGETLSMNQAVYAAGGDGEEHNRFLAGLLVSQNRIYCDPAEACDVFVKQCSINITARQLAIMGATLANNGLNPVTKERCLDAKYIGNVFPVSLTTKLYDDSGVWGREGGLPVIHGIGGGVLAVVPGKVAIVGFSPRLNDEGCSVTGAKMVSHILDQLNVNLVATVR